MSSNVDPAKEPLTVGELDMMKTEVDMLEALINGDKKALRSLRKALQKHEDFNMNAAHTQDMTVVVNCIDEIINENEQKVLTIKAAIYDEEVGKHQTDRHGIV